MRTLIAGAAGFLGKNALLRFPRDWEIGALYRPDHGGFAEFLKRHQLAHVRPYACDLTEAKRVQAAAKALGAGWDQCLFLAANTSIPDSIEQPAMDLCANTLTLLNTLHEFRFGHLVFLSSGAVYDGCEGLVGPETPLAPSLPYAISKMAAERYIQAWHTYHGNPARATIVRFFGAYGPYEPPRKLYTKLTRRFAFEHDPRFTMNGDGENYIDAMYVEDAIDALRATLDQPATGVEIVDLGVGGHETINSLVSRAARAFGLEAVITHVGKPHENIRCYIDPERFTARYGARPSVALEDGLRGLARHLREEDQRASP